MRNGRANRAWLPSARDEWLLRAALGRSDGAIDAWSRWRASTMLDEAGYAASQILPLAYRNLSRLGLDDPELGRLKGIYRHAWSRNQLILRAGAGALRALQAAGVEAIVLKGAALATIYYRDLGARPMVDFDVLVRRDRVYEAMDALRAGGLRPHEVFPDPERRVPVHHSTSFVAPGGHEVDLHWYSLWQSAPEPALWEASVPMEIAGVATATLCSEDHLIQVCGHGAQWSPTGSLRWVADAVKVIGATPELDWDRVAVETIRRRLTPTILDALEYLRATFRAEIPESALDRLRADRVTLAEAAARRAARLPVNQRRLLITHWDRYRRLKRLDPDAPRQRSFPAQLKESWGSPSFRAFGLHAARRLLRIDR